MLVIFYYYFFFTLNYCCRHSTQPRELICEARSSTDATELEKRITECVASLLAFLRSHRYDPTEYYGEQDYLAEIPDPCCEPIAVVEEFSDIVRMFGI